MLCLTWDTLDHKPVWLNIMTSGLILVSPLKEKMLQNIAALWGTTLCSFQHTLLTWTLLIKVKQHKDVSLSRYFVLVRYICQSKGASARLSVSRVNLFLPDIFASLKGMIKARHVYFQLCTKTTQILRDRAHAGVAFSAHVCWVFVWLALIYDFKDIWMEKLDVIGKFLPHKKKTLF